MHCAAIIALWARYAEGSTEAGEPIDIVDLRKDDVVAAAAAQEDRPLAFLEQSDFFADLAANERFASTYLRVLESLHDRGVRATLAALESLSSAR